jgi:hypothetical protein
VLEGTGCESALSHSQGGTVCMCVCVCLGGGEMGVLIAGVCAVVGSKR